VVGGGAGEERLIAREIYPRVPMEALPARVAEMLRGYLAHRRMPAESFHDFTKRHSVDELKELFAPCREIAA
jgi:ferredoxin-nitrite reductase